MEAIPLKSPPERIDTRVQELLEAPDAKLVIERAQAILVDEAQRRRAFRE